MALFVHQPWGIELRGLEAKKCEKLLWTCSRIWKCSDFLRFLKLSFYIMCIHSSPGTQLNLIPARCGGQQNLVWTYVTFVIYGLPTGNYNFIRGWPPYFIFFWLACYVEVAVKRCFIFYTLLFSQCVQRKANLNLEARTPLRCRLS
jgi:hypothetical protein